MACFDFRGPLEEVAYSSKGSAADLIHLAQSQEGVQQQSGITKHRRHSHPSSKGRASFLHSQKSTCLVAETTSVSPEQGRLLKSFVTGLPPCGKISFLLQSITTTHHVGAGGQSEETVTLDKGLGRGMDARRKGRSLGRGLTPC